MIAVICPTIPGREESLERTIASYDEPVWVYRDSPSSGEGWMEGLREFVAANGEPDYVHFTNDDCELIGSLEPAMEACDRGRLPAPIVREPDGSLQSAGGDMSAGGNLLREIGEDWQTVGFTTIPFMSWDQWQKIGMLPLHYCSDVWVSHRGAQLGIPTVLRHGYEFRHYNHPVGRGAGMTQGARADQDRQRMEEALAAASYDTHLPALEAICGLLQPQRILEYGSGLHSTPYLLSLPGLERLVSVESDPGWRTKVGELLEGDERLELVAETTADPKDFDLVFIDNGDSARERGETIRAVLSTDHPSTLIHDSEVYAAVIEECGAKYITLGSTEPHTALVWR